MTTLVARPTRTGKVLLVRASLETYGFWSFKNLSAEARARTDPTFVNG